MLTSIFLSRYCSPRVFSLLGIKATWIFLSNMLCPFEGNYQFKRGHLHRGSFGEELNLYLFALCCENIKTRFSVVLNFILVELLFREIRMLRFWSDDLRFLRSLCLLTFIDLVHSVFLIEFDIFIFDHTILDGLSFFHGSEVRLFCIISHCCFAFRILVLYFNQFDFFRALILWLIWYFFGLRVGSQVYAFKKKNGR